jgi:HK97 gp10 family phage protein
MAGYSVKIKRNDLPKIIRETPEKADRAVKAAAFETERYIKTSFSSGRSFPGQPPGVDQGKLKGGINTKFIRLMVYSVNTGDTEYAPMLEFGTRKMAARPFMGPAAKEAEKLLKAAFERLFG